MPHSRNPVPYETFSSVYDAKVQSRTFVESHDYYKAVKSRFWQSFHEIDQLGLPEGSKALDIGGGIMAVLLAELLGFDAMVGDVNDTARKDVEEIGLGFVIFDLFSDEEPAMSGFDLVILTEVIEHIPQPPYIVFGRIAKLLAPGGRLFITTPNGHRFRNLVYMALGKEILDIYRYPEPGQGLGHQHEYTLKQLLWQAGHADFEVEMARYYQDGFKGASLKARIAWILAKPATLVSYMKNGIMMVLRKPA